MSPIHPSQRGPLLPNIPKGFRPAWDPCPSSCTVGVHCFSTGIPDVRFGWARVFLAKSIVPNHVRVQGRPHFATSMTFMTFMTCTRVTSGTRFTFFSRKSVLHDVAPHYGFCPKSHARTMVLPSFHVHGRPHFSTCMTSMTCTRVTSGTRFTFFPECPFYTMLPRTMVFGQNHMRVPWFCPVFMYTGDLILQLP